MEPTKHKDLFALALGKTLSILREKHGCSQAQMAAKLDTTQTVISRWELGKEEISTLNAIAYGQVVGQSIEDLVEKEKIIIHRAQEFSYLAANVETRDDGEDWWPLAVARWGEKASLLLDAASLSTL